MAKDGDNSFGVASVILGILGLVVLILTFLALLAPLTGFILSVLSLVFAIIQRKKEKNGWAKAGLILAIIGIVINGVILVWFVSLIVGITHQYQSLCDAAGGCDKIVQYLQSQQVQQLTSQSSGASYGA